MLDLSEETKEENIADCVKYFKRMAKMERESPFPYLFNKKLIYRMARDGNRYHRR
jgi:hypothetical protein